MSVTQTAFDRMILEYHIPSLPTAQHKAGLAGLILQISEMMMPDRKFDSDDIPVVEEVGPLSARIQLTERSCIALMNELYHAEIEPVTVTNKWSGQQPVNTETKEIVDPETGKPKKVHYFTYEVVTPRNSFLMRYLDDESWQKLWRDMLFNIPRSRPTTRRPYNFTADGESSGEGEKIWKVLLRWDKERQKGKLRTTSVSGALLLGAQDVTAEQVPFEDQSDHALLLHFWPLTTLIYVPWQLDVNYANPKRSRDQPVGYSLAIPEVCDLKSYCKRFPLVLGQLASKKQRRGYRPADACIDLPAQSALEFLTQQAWVVQEKAGSTVRLRGQFNAVEYRHLAKFGNNVKSLGSGRIAPDENLLTHYEGIVSHFHNSLFRAAMLKGLLNQSDQPWYAPFGDLFETFPREFFLRSEQTPIAMRNFASDLARKFQTLQHEVDSLSKEALMASDRSDDRLPLVVRWMVRNYVRQKAEDRSGISWDSFKDKKISDKESNRERIAVPNDYREAQEHVAEKAFLEVRSRHGEDFGRYFADCFGSVGQRAISNDDDFQLIAEALLKRPDDVRVLTLLALSASY